MPGRVDSNSPAFWRDGRFHLLTSAGAPLISQGDDQFSLESSERVVVDPPGHLPMWIEAAWADSDGTVFAWYHHEPGGVCPGSALTAPQIGALVSYDGGRTFLDLGLVLTSGDPVDCTAKNGFFAGGHGDFSVILDREQGYFYFLFTNYGGEAAGQGIAVARLAFEDRRNPVGAVRKHFQSAWDEPGLGGRVTPIFPVAASWQRADTNSLWGPSLHWNTYLESYVVLLNHACCRPMWPQAGVYVSFNPDLSDPAGWSTPQRILDQPHAYYPQVVGIDAGETDTLAGRVVRLYLQGCSAWELLFNKVKPWEEEVPGEPPEPPPPDWTAVRLSVARPPRP
jgi:hypothetical protein